MTLRSRFLFGQRCLRGLLVLLTCPCVICGQTPDSFDPHANDGVLALAVQPDGKLLLGGYFSAVNYQFHNGLARVNPDGVLDWSFPTASGVVTAITLQPDGKALVGGRFGDVGGVGRANIARVNPDGSLDAAFNPGSTDGIECLAIQADGKILVGARPGTIAGVWRDYIARLNPDGTIDAGFNPAVNRYIWSIGIQTNGQIVVGGWFTALEGQPRDYLGRLNSNGTLDNTFTNGIGGVQFPGVNCVLVQADGKIVVGGTFLTLGGQARTNLGRLNADGSLDMTFAAGANGEVFSLAQQTDGRILVSGGFSELGGQPCSTVGRLNANGTFDSTFNASATGQVSALALQPDGKLLLGGWVNSVGGQPRSCIARVNNTAPATQSLSKSGSTVTWARGGTSPEVWRTTFEASTDGVTWSSLGTGARVTGGWQVTGVSLPTRRTLRARGYLQAGYYQGSGGLMETLSGNLAISQQPLDRTNNAGTLANFTVLAGGGSSTNRYQWRRAGTNLIDGGNISGATSAMLSISNALGADAAAYSVAITNGTEFLISQSAQLTVIDPVINIHPVSQWASNGQTAVFTVQATGTMPLACQWRWEGTNLPGASESSLSLTNVQPSSRGSYDVVVVSSFGSVTSSPAILGTTDPFNPNVNGAVHCLVVQPDGKVVLGGAFTSVGGQPRTNLARVCANGDLDPLFNPGADSDVYALTIQDDGRILVGGNFATLGGQPHPYLGRLNLDGTLDGAFTPAPNSMVFCLAMQTNGMILVSGWFTNLAGEGCYRLGRLSPTGARDSSFNPSPDSAVGSIAVQADGKIVVGGGFSNVGGLARNRLARLNADGTADTSFVDPQVWNGVSAVAVQPDGKVLIGGSVDNLGGVGRYWVARVNADGTLDTAWNAGVIGGPVNSIVVQADGRILLGGSFYSVAGQTRNNIVRVFANGTLDTTFNPGANGQVECLTLQPDGQVLAGGGFTSLGGENRTRLGRLNPTQAATNSLVLNGTTLTWLRGAAAPQAPLTTFAACTNGIDWFDLGAGTRITSGWQLNGVTLPAAANVRARAPIVGDPHGSSWYCETMIGPPLLYSQPASRTNLPATTAYFSINAIGGAPLTFQWQKNGTNLADAGNISGSGTATLTVSNAFGADMGTYRLILSNAWGSVTSLVASLTVIDPLLLTPLASQNATPGQNVTFSVGVLGSEPLSYQWSKNGAPVPGVTASSLSLTNVQITDAAVYQVIITNAFGAITSTVSLTVNGATSDGLTAPMNGPLSALAVQADGAVVLGGNFTTVASQSRSRIARLSAAGTLDNYDPNANGNLNAIAIQTNGMAVVGGEFNMIAGLLRLHIARLNSDGSADTSFDPGAIGSVKALALQADGGILVGGEFTTLAGANRTNLGRLNPDGSIDSFFNADADGAVYALAVQPDGKILVAGSFTRINGQPRLRLARLGPDGSLDAAFNSTPWDSNSAPAYALALQADGRILAGGSFSQAGGPRIGVRRFDGNGNLDSGFALAITGQYYGPEVHALAVQTDGRILVAGVFETLSGLSRGNLGRVDADGAVDLTFNPGSGWTYALGIQPDGKILVGGGISRLNNTGPASDSVSFDTSSATWLRAGTSSESWRVTFDASTNGIVWTAPAAAARVSGGWTATGLSIPPGSVVRARGFVVGGNWYVETLAGTAVFSSQPASQTNNAATTAAFAVTAVGPAPLSYQWLKNGAPLANAGNASGTLTSALTLTNVYGPDGGSYQVVVSNAWGSVTSLVASLTVVEPLITGQPANQSANVGQSATFNVTAIGTAPLGYQWRLNGTPFGSGTNSSLTLTNVQRSDARPYTVTISNQFGVVTSAVATLAVNVAVADSFNAGSSAAVSQFILPPDGKVLVAGLFGSPNNPQYLARFYPDGPRDPGFVFSNKVIDASSIYSLGLQPDGRIVGSGLGRQVLPGPLWRVNSDGSLDTGFTNQISGSIYGLVLRPEGQAWAGGNFTYAKPAILTNLAFVEPDGAVNTNLVMAISGTIYGLALQPDGDVLAGGAFTLINGQTAIRLARFTAAGVLDTNFNASANNTVYSVLVQPDGKVLVAGAFTTLNGAAVNRVGRLNSDGTLDTNFNPNVNSTVYSIALQTDGKIIIGGGFMAVSGQSRSRLARLNPDGSVDPLFNPGASGTVYAVGIQANGAVVVGGSFSTLAGQYRTNIARLVATDPATQSLTLDGSTLNWARSGTTPEVWRTTFEISTNDAGWVSLGAGERVSGGWRLTGVTLPAEARLRARGFIAGGQNNAGSWYVESSLGPLWLTSQPASRTNQAGTTATFWVSASGGEPLAYQWLKDGRALAAGGKISGTTTRSLTLSNVLGGDVGAYSVIVTNAGGSVTSSVAYLAVIEPVITSQPVSVYTNVGQSVSFSVGAIGTAPVCQWRKNGTNIPGATATSLVFTTAQREDIAGYSAVVTTFYGSVTSTVANLTLNLSLPDSLSVELSDEVRSLAIQPDGKILIGGNFSYLGAKWVGEFARLYPDGTHDSNFFGHANSSVDTVAVQPDGNILVGGWFNYMNDWPHSHIGRFFPDGSLDPAINPAINTYGVFVDSLVYQPDGKILVGGSFTTLAGQTRNNIARLNANGTLDAFNPSANAHVMALALQPDGRIVAAGNFTYLGGQTRNRIGRLNSDGTLDTTFDPNANSTVDALVLQPDGKILVGGSFTTLAGQNRNYLARLNSNGSVDTSFNPVLNGGVSGIALQADGSVVLAGGFTTVGGLPRGGLARVSPAGTVDPYWSPQVAGGVNGVAIQPDGKILVGGSFTSVCGQPRLRLGRVDGVTPADHSLACDATGVTWRRRGASPEVSGTWFETSSDGTNWTSLGTATRDAGGWRVNTPSLALNSYVRARGFASGGRWNGSLGLIEEVTQVSTATAPVILAAGSSFGFRTNLFSFDVRALAGQLIVVEGTTNFVTWVLLQTNLVASLAQFVFTDLQSAVFPRRFYRARASTNSPPPPGIWPDGSAGFQSGQFGFNLSGVVGQTVVVEASTNLQNWVPITTNQLDLGPLYLRDPDSTNFPFRFYRARVP